MRRALSFLLSIVPFVFGLIRAVETDGADLRYIWVAFAAFAGGMLRLSLARGRAVRPHSPYAIAAGVLIFSTVAAALAARVLGTSVNPAMFIVALAFGACYAAAAFVQMAPPRRQG